MCGTSVRAVITGTDRKIQKEVENIFIRTHNRRQEEKLGRENLGGNSGERKKTGDGEENILAGTIINRENAIKEKKEKTGNKSLLHHSAKGNIADRLTSRKKRNCETSITAKRNSWCIA